MLCTDELNEMVVLQMWQDLINKAKDANLDVIETYVFWNVHEPSPGNVSVQFVQKDLIFMFACC